MQGAVTTAATQHGHTQPAIAGIVLASGMSRRFGAGNKLLARFGSQSVISCTVQAYIDADLAPLLVVVGYQAEEIVEALDGRPIQVVPNPDFLEGQSRALRHSMLALPESTAAAVIGVGDQPLLRPETIRSLIDEYHRSDAPLVLPRYADRRGNPVLFDRRLFPDLLRVKGDQGGRSVVESHLGEAAWVEIADMQSGADIDTEGDLAHLEIRTR
ncbi:MAG: nucleotidyltransferase family protein [Chloroflexota bacterium]|nr:nucleotidyltransferase family protein [Chloroflexota bacterium]